MNYEALRHAADSWGLVFMVVAFLVLFGWTFRRDSKAVHKRAAVMIFDDKEEDQHD